MTPKSTSRKTSRKTSRAASTVKAPATGKSAPETGARSIQARPTVAVPADDKRQITFTYFAPQAGSVLVAGDFTQWEHSPINLVKEGAGMWKTTIALKPGKYQYRLLVDGQWLNDPRCPELLPNEFGSTNCVLSVAV